MAVRHAIAVTGPRSSADRVRPFLEAAGNDCRIEILDHPQLDEVAAALAARPDCIILFGGDGTLNRYLGLLLRAQVPILLVPTGSGNDFAMAHLIRSAQDALVAFRHWLQGKLAPVAADIAAATIHDAENVPQQKYFSCCVNVGVDAEAVYRANRLPNWLKAHGGYLIGGLGAIFAFRPRRYSLRIGTSPVTDETLWFIAGLNTPTYGGGLRIAPFARTDDRMLHLVLCQATSRFNLLRNMPRLFSGDVQDISFLRFAGVEDFSVTTATPEPVCADGEVLGFTPLVVRFAGTIPVLAMKKPPA